MATPNDERDAERFRRLFDQHGRDVNAYVLRRAEPGLEAADVVADTFTIIWRRIREIPAEPETRAYLFGVARRALANARRGEVRRGRLRSRLGQVGGDLPAVVPDPAGARDNTFEYLAGFLGESQASPALRAALYRAAALIPGVEEARGITDPAGRRGNSVAVVDEQGIRNELIFDPATAAPLAWRLTTTRPVKGFDAAPGTVTGEVVYLARGVVGSTSARPAGG